MASTASKRRQHSAARRGLARLRGPDAETPATAHPLLVRVEVSRLRLTVDEESCPTSAKDAQGTSAVDRGAWHADPRQAAQTVARHLAYDLHTELAAQRSHVERACATLHSLVVWIIFKNYQFKKYTS